MEIKFTHLDKMLIVAFIQGAKWWEYHQTQCTMWNSDQELAERSKKVKRENINKAGGFT